MRKALSMKQHIKPQKELENFSHKLLSIEFETKLLSFVSFNRFSGVKIYKIWMLYFLWHKTYY